MIRCTALSLLGLICAVVCAAPARAAYGPFTLVSGSPKLDLAADYAFDPVLSSDGRYVAYTGAITSMPGVYRTEIATGSEEVVALGADTGTPSISEDGRYVSFTTDDDPSTGQRIGGGCSSVYVRDMQLPIQAPGAFTLASTRDGSSESLAYAPPQGVGQACGSAATYRVALSGDGNEVVFTVLSPSDLASPPGQTSTPGDQVAVHYRDSDRTELVSTTLGGEAAPAGAALTGAGTSEGNLEPDGLPLPISASTAAISANGSAVAWMGINVQAQIKLDTTPPNGGRVNGFAEPLWRRITDSPGPTRSVFAGEDASASSCPPECPGGLDLLWNEGVEITADLGPLYGSFLSTPGFAVTGTSTDPLAVITPQMSEDGNTVALLSTQPDYGHDPTHTAGGTSLPPTANAFVVNMAPALTRAQSITRLTAWATRNFDDFELAGPINGITISRDGSKVAFITSRTTFPLAPPALITPPVSQATHQQLYVANLKAGTLELASNGYNGEPSDNTILAASFDQEGKTLALATGAANLAFGSASGNGAEVLISHELGSPLGEGRQTVSPLPPLAVPTPHWQLSATVSHGAGGSLLLSVTTPGAGTLEARARAALPARAARSPRAVVITRQVSRASSLSKGAGAVHLRLSLPRRYLPLLRKIGDLYAYIAIKFTAAGHRPLEQELQASFRTSRAAGNRRTVRRGKRGPGR